MRPVHFLQRADTGALFVLGPASGFAMQWEQQAGGAPRPLRHVFRGVAALAADVT
ncbi:hypothetical protein tb265_20310 [Gemmatimonadetes bacterium T265]|nr:hypothetical protein tb265_20310 [Gemmatimonadetes bacterium T265]